LHENFVLSVVKMQLPALPTF